MDAAAVRALLVCPACRSSLAAAAPGWRCDGCGLAFEEAGGVPILMAAEERAENARARASWGGERVTTASNAPLLDRLRRFLPPPAPFLNLVSGRNLERLDRLLAAASPAEALLLNLGSGDGTGAGMARLGRALRQERMLNLDVDPFPGVDVVAGGSALPFADGRFAAVMLKAVLEHVPDWQATLDEARRVTLPGGWIYIELPFLFEYHPNPGDFVRFTRAGLAQALAGFDDVEIGTLIGPWAATASLLAHAVALALSGGSRLLRKGLLPWLTWLTWPLSLPDLWVVGNPASHFVAHHLYAFARVPQSGVRSRRS